MSGHIVISPITWTNDNVPELGGKFPRDSAVLGPILARYDLKLVGGWWDGRILERSVGEEFEALLPHLVLHRDLGARRIVYADTSRGRHGGIWDPISNRPTLADDEWDAYGRKLTTLADKMDEFGVGMAFHHRMGTIVESDAEVDRLMAVTGPSVGLLYDTGHSAFSGGDPVALVTRHVGRIVHVHCKDTRPDMLARARRDDMSFMQAVLDGIFTVPGGGSVDYATILRRLHDGGYEGWLVVEAEQDPRKANPLTYASLGYRDLLALATAAGFSVETRESAPT